MMATNWPFSTEKDTPSNARTWFSPSPYTFVRFSTRNISMDPCSFSLDGTSISRVSDSPVTIP